MTGQNVKLKILTTLGLDTSDAERQVQGMKERIEGLGRSTQQQTQRFQQAHQRDPVIGPHLQQTELQKRTTQWLKEHNVQQGTFLENKKKLNNLYQEELSHVRSLEHEMSELKHTQHGLSREQLLSREREVREARGFVNHLRNTISTGMTQEVYQRELRGGMTQQVAQVGGAMGVGRMLGGLGRFALRNLWLAIPAVIAGGAVMGQKQADESAAYSERIGMQVLDVARQTGRRRTLRERFYQAPGEVQEAFQRLGYSGEHLAKMATTYGMPGGNLKEDLLAQGRFARAFGFHQQPELMAGMGRRATQFGVAEPGQQGPFWAMMTAAVQTGIQQGVDASDTLKAMMGYSEKTAERLGLVTREHVSGLGAVQALLSGGASRLFKGERGARETDILVEGVTNPKSIAAQRFTMNAILGAFGGRAPRADELGFTGYEAKAYASMTQIQQLEAVMQKLPQFLASGTPQAQRLMSDLFRRFSVSAGSGPAGRQLLFEAIYGMRLGKALTTQQGVFEAVAALPGMDRNRALAMGPFELLSELTARAPEKALRLLRGTQPNAELSKAEQFQAMEWQIKEMGSARYEQSKTIETLRETMKNIRKGITGGLTEQLLGTEDVAEQLKDEALKVLPFGGHLRGALPAGKAAPWCACVSASLPRQSVSPASSDSRGCQRDCGSSWRGDRRRRGHPLWTGNWHGVAASPQRPSSAGSDPGATTWPMV